MINQEQTHKCLKNNTKSSESFLKNRNPHPQPQYE